MYLKMGFEVINKLLEYQKQDTDGILFSLVENTGIEPVTS